MCGTVPSKVPALLLSSRCGDKSTWTQAQKDYNDDLRSLLIAAKLRPFASAAQPTAALVDVMLRHPAVFHSTHDDFEPPAEDGDMAELAEYVLSILP